MDRGRVEREVVDSGGTKIGDAIAGGVEVSRAVISGVGAFGAVPFGAVAFGAVAFGAVPFGEGTFEEGTFEEGTFGVVIFGAGTFGRGDRGAIALRAAPSGTTAFAAAVFETGGFAAAVLETGGFAAAVFETGGFGAGVRGPVVPGVVVPAVAESPEDVRGAAGRRTRGDVAGASAGRFTDASGAPPEVGIADAPAGFSSASESITQPYQRPLVCLSENWASHHKLGT